MTEAVFQLWAIYSYINDPSALQQCTDARTCFDGSAQHSNYSKEIICAEAMVETS